MEGYTKAKRISILGSQLRKINDTLNLVVDLEMDRIKTQIGNLVEMAKAKERRTSKDASIDPRK
jgi:hypothetical protein